VTWEAAAENICIPHAYGFLQEIHYQFCQGGVCGSMADEDFAYCAHCSSFDGYRASDSGMYTLMPKSVLASIRNFVLVLFSIAASATLTT
jgi:hypothetical protein